MFEREREMSSSFMRLLNWYHACNSRSPYITNCTTGFLIASIGDFLCQRYFEHPNKLKTMMLNNIKIKVKDDLDAETGESWSSPSKLGEESINSSSGLPPSSSSGSVGLTRRTPSNLAYRGSKEDPEQIKQYDMNNDIEPSKTSDNQGLPLDFEWNSLRSLQMGLIRATVITPFVLFWYPLLQRLCPGTTLVRIAGRVILDQSIACPIVIVLVFTANTLMNQTIFHPNLKLSNLRQTWSQSISLEGLGDSLKNIIVTVGHQIEDRLWITWKTGIQYWSIVHCFTFGVVPLAHQALFAHFASVYWNAVLSYYANMRKEKK